MLHGNALRSGPSVLQTGRQNGSIKDHSNEQNMEDATACEHLSHNSVILQAQQNAKWSVNYNKLQYIYIAIIIIIT